MPTVRCLSPREREHQEKGTISFAMPRCKLNSVVVDQAVGLMMTKVYLDAASRNNVENERCLLSWVHYVVCKRVLCLRLNLECVAYSCIVG